MTEVAGGRQAERDVELTDISALQTDVKSETVTGAFQPEKVSPVGSAETVDSHSSRQVG